MSNKPRKKIDNNLQLLQIEPKTEAQKKVFESKKHLVLHGSAGTGKTFITSYLAYQLVLQRKEYEKLVYIRSAVPTRNLGFLPGTESEKTQVYEQPYHEIAAELFGRADAYGILRAADAVRFVTTSHIRGITLRESIVIVDECQNMTYQELDTIITRMGPCCKIYFCGDWYQRDLKDTGIREFYQILRRMEEFDFVNFTIDDVVRSPLVKNYLKAKYDQSHSQQPNISSGNTSIPALLAKGTNVRDSQLQQSDDADSHSELRPHKTWIDESADRPN